MKKKPLNESIVLLDTYATSDSIKNLNKTQMQLYRDNNITTDTDRFNNKNNILFTKGYHFQDSEDIFFNHINIFYTKKQINKNLDFAFDIGYFDIGKKDDVKYEGFSYAVSVFLEHFFIRLALNDYNDFNEFVPTLKYQNRYNNSTYTLAYTRENALFYTYSPKAYEYRITANHFSISDYTTFKNNKDIWASLELNMFSNNDTEITAQYDFRFYNDTFVRKNLSYYIALEGWYTSHSKQHDYFYSPTFSDSTLVRIDPQYIFSKYFTLKGSVGIGHSFKETNQPYKLGLWLFGASDENMFSYKIGCMHSSSAKLSGSPTYNYKECEINLEYQW